MRHTRPLRWSLVALGALLAGLPAWPATGGAQPVSGQARVVHATVVTALGTATTVLSDTGALLDATDARQASELAGDIPSLLAGEALHATTIGWPDQVASEASVADLAMTVAGTPIGADFVMARALAVPGAAGGAVSIEGLSIAGLPIPVTGDPNQLVSIPGGLVVINEQQTSPAGVRVNALHVIVYGVADVVVASAAAGVQ